MMEKIWAKFPRLFILMVVLVQSTSCSTQKERDHASMQQGNFSVLFPSVDWDQMLKAETSAENEERKVSTFWFPEKLAKKKVLFGTLESRYLTFIALFEIYFPFKHLNANKNQVKSLAQLIAEKIWLDVREDKEWLSFLTVLSNLKLFHAKMARPLIYEFTRQDSISEKDWRTLESGVKKILLETKGRKDLPGFFNLTKEGREELLYILQTGTIPFLSKMVIKTRASILRTIYEEYFGPLNAGKSIPSSGSDEVVSFEKQGPEEEDTGADEEYEDEEANEARLAQEKRVKLARKIHARNPHISKCHLNYNPKTRTIEGDVDVAVVGAGSTGSFLAYLLWKSGLKVLLIEKGNLPTHYSQMGKENALWAMGFLNGIKKAEESNNFIDGGKVLYFKPNVVGGGDTLGPLLNMNLHSPLMQQYIHSKREAEALPPPFYDVDKLSDINLTTRRLSHSRAYMDESLSGREKSFVQSGLDAELEVNQFESSYDFSQGTGGIFSKSQTSYDWYLKKGIFDHKNPLCLLTRVEVQKLVGSNVGAQSIIKWPVLKTLKWPPLVKNEIYSRLRSTLPDETIMKVNPRIVILSAGVPGTLKILQNSGIKHAKAGKDIAFNYSALLMGLYRGEVGEVETPFSNIAFGPKREYSNSQYQYMIYEMPLNGPQFALTGGGSMQWTYPMFRHGKNIRTFLVSLMNENVVGQDFDNNKFSYPNLDANYEKLKEGLLAAAKMQFQLGASAVFLPALTHKNIPALFRTYQELTAFLKNLNLAPYENPMLVFAPNGGLLRGANAQLTPLDLKWRPVGFRNLYVMDASVLPPGAGPFHSFIIKSLATILARNLTE